MVLSVFNTSQAAIQDATCAVVLHHTCWGEGLMARRPLWSPSGLIQIQHLLPHGILNEYMVF
jgi:hypothetical protein